MLFTKLAMLGLESQQVIGLRLVKLAFGGPAAARESVRMVTEKVAALGESTVIMAAGGSPEAVVDGFRRTVRANRARLSRI